MKERSALLPASGLLHIHKIMADNLNKQYISSNIMRHLTDSWTAVYPDKYEC